MRRFAFIPIWMVCAILGYSYAFSQDPPPVKEITSSSTLQLRWDGANTLVQLSQEGDTLRTHVDFIDLETETVVESFQGQSAIQSIEVNPAGMYLASIDDNYNLDIWNLKDSDIYLEYSLDELQKILGPSLYLTSLSWHPIEPLLVVNFENYVVILNIANEDFQIIDVNRSTSAVEWSPDGKSLAYSTKNGAIYVLSYPSMELLEQLEEPSQFIIAADNTSQQLSWSPDSKYIALFHTRYMNKAQDIILIRSLDSPDEVTVLRGHSDDITAIEWSPDGSWLASSSLDKTVRIWNTSTFLPDYIWQFNDSVNTLSWQPVGSLIAVGTAGENIMLFDVAK